MTDDTSVSGAPPAAAPPPPSPPSPAVETELPPITAGGHPNPNGLPDIAVDRPEVAVGAAFAGGLVLALILKRFGR